MRIKQFSLLLFSTLALFLEVDANDHSHHLSSIHKKSKHFGHPLQAPGVEDTSVNITKRALKWDYGGSDKVRGVSLGGW